MRKTAFRILSILALLSFYSFASDVFALPAAPTYYASLANRALLSSSPGAYCTGVNSTYTVGTCSTLQTSDTKLRTADGLQGKTGPGSQSCQCLNSSGNVAGSTAQTQVCGLPGTMSGTYPNVTCSACPPGHVEQNGVCVVPDPCDSKAGQTFSSGYFDLGTSPSARFQHLGCDGGCSTVFNGSSPAASSLVDGITHYYAKGDFIYDGDTCSTGPSPSAGPQPPDDCATGQTLGQVNGKNVCVNGDGSPSDPNQPPPTPAPPPPDTKTETAPTTNPDGSSSKTTTTTTTKNDITTTTTTTTTTNADGSSSSSTTSSSAPANPAEPAAPNPDPMEDFCVKNPTNQLCKEQKEGTFGGTCGAFTCTGDPVQCAIAKEQHSRNCTMFVTETTQSTLGNALGNGTDTGVSSNPANVENREIINLPSTLDQTKVFGNSCMSDLSVTVSGTSLTIPFSNLCPYMQMMGRIVVAFSLLVAARIVAGGVA